MYPQAGVLYLTAVLFLSFISIRALAKTVILNNQDAGIDYEPSVGTVAGGWERISDSTDPAGGYMMSTMPGSTATIMCSFINASFWSPKWPYPITTAVYIDGVANIVDLQDYSVQAVTDQTVLPTLPSNIIFTYTGTVNEPHTIVVSTPPSGSFAVMDMFSFDVTDWSISTGTSPPISTTSSSPSATSVDSIPTATPTSLTGGLSTDTPATKVPSVVPTASPTDPNETSSPSVLSSDAARRKAKVMQVTIGVLVGAILILLSWILVIYLYYRRQRRRPCKNARLIDPVIPFPATGRFPWTEVSRPNRTSSASSTTSGSRLISPAQSHQSYDQGRTLSTHSNTSQTRLIVPAQLHRPNSQPQEDGKYTPAMPDYKDLPALPNPHPTRSTVRVMNSRENPFEKAVYPAEKRVASPTVLEWDPNSRYRPTPSYAVPATSLRRKSTAATSRPTLSMYEDAELLHATRVSKLPARSRPPMPPPYHLGDESSKFMR
ncbi:hypothetical protein HYPSUDRAFT_86069 [Hypholoma sublateritium FD-334 SS-4]|uniref:Mid2 domain-containing protein n=1 Tax=Hypholoma sublateritium (strain FD-334 SS-4) TaxID=945553 RepID=A0A0D2P6S6_HYPSF|nr:hypothetical protein HYPSUDRAFT_86069 [Hypholoma sublateritium FD-334 SS-4]